KLCEHNGISPEFSWMIAAAVEFIRKFSQVVRLCASRWKHPERAAQPVRDQRKPHHGAQHRLGPGKERLIDGTELREDKRGRVNHLVRLRRYSGRKRRRKPHPKVVNPHRAFRAPRRGQARARSRRDQCWWLWTYRFKLYANVTRARR